VYPKALANGFLENEVDIRTFLDALRERLAAAIAKNKRVEIR
jgi:hypothetical protein